MEILSQIHSVQKTGPLKVTTPTGDLRGLWGLNCSPLAHGKHFNCCISSQSASLHDYLKIMKTANISKLYLF